MTASLSALTMLTMLLAADVEPAPKTPPMSLKTPPMSPKAGTDETGKTPDAPRRVWEVDLLPGTFRVQSEKLPHIDPSRGELDYFTVAFHTPDNVQFVIAYGSQRVKPPPIKEFLQAATWETSKVAEVRKVKGEKDNLVRVIANDAEGFTFTLKEKTRVFFAAEGVVWRKMDKCETKMAKLLPDWSPLRYSYEKQVRQFPMLLHWHADREVYQLEIEAFGGNRNYHDWLIAVDYLE